MLLVKLVSPDRSWTSSSVLHYNQRALQNIPYFGEYQKLREQKIAEIKAKSNPLDKVAEVTRPAPNPVSPIPTIKDVIGKAVNHIGAYNNLNNKEQVVALIDDDMCINCGKCYMACADSGYQAIQFDSETHIPKVTDDCTGCTLCLSVCPIIDCITMIPKTIPHVINRGIPPKGLFELSELSHQLPWKEACRLLFENTIGNSILYNASCNYK